MSWVLIYTVITAYGAVHATPHHGFSSYESCVEYGNGLAELHYELYPEDGVKVDCEKE